MYDNIYTYYVTDNFGNVYQYVLNNIYYPNIVYQDYFFYNYIDQYGMLQQFVYPVNNWILNCSNICYDQEPTPMEIDDDEIVYTRKRIICDDRGKRNLKKSKKYHITTHITHNYNNRKYYYPITPVLVPMNP